MLDAGSLRSEHNRENAYAAKKEQSIINVSTHKNFSRFEGRFKFLGQGFLAFFDDKCSKFGFAIYFKVGYACAKDGDQNGRIQI